MIKQHVNMYKNEKGLLSRVISHLIVVGTSFAYDSPVQSHHLVALWGQDESFKWQIKQTKV